MHDTPALGTLRRTKRDYWEKERERLVLALLDRLTGGRETIALRELLQQEIPDVLKAVLRNHARQLVRKEKPLVLHSLRQYELNDQAVRKHLRDLRDMLAERIVFDSAELKPVLSFGIRLQFDVIARPRAALDQLLYRHSTERDRDDVIIILKGLGNDRPFLTNLIDKLLNYPEGSVTKEAFLAACRQAEREVYNSEPVAALTRDLKDYLNYCRTIIGERESGREGEWVSGRVGENDKIDNQTVLAMLFERNFAELAESLLPEFTQKESWEIDEIARLIEQHLATSGIRFESGEAGTVFVPPEVDIDSLLGEAASEIESQLVQTEVRELRGRGRVEEPENGREGEKERGREGERETGRVGDGESGREGEQTDERARGQEGERKEESGREGEWERGRTGDGESSSSSSTLSEDQDQTTEVTTLAEQADSEHDTRDTHSPTHPLTLSPSLPLSLSPSRPSARPSTFEFDEGEQLIYRSKLEQQPSGPFPSIYKLIDDKSRKAFIRKVFQRDTDAYLDFFERIEAIQTWKEAKALLDNELNTRKVNPYSKEAVRLSDLLFGRYFSKR